MDRDQTIPFNRSIFQLRLGQSLNGRSERLRHPFSRGQLLQLMSAIVSTFPKIAEDAAPGRATRPHRWRGMVSQSPKAERSRKGAPVLRSIFHSFLSFPVFGLASFSGNLLWPCGPPLEYRAIKNAAFSFQIGSMGLPPNYRWLPRNFHLLSQHLSGELKIKRNRHTR